MFMGGGKVAVLRERTRRRGCASQSVIMMNLQCDPLNKNVCK